MSYYLRASGSHRLVIRLAAALVCAALLGGVSARAGQSSKQPDSAGSVTRRGRSPIRHLIVFIGENRSFDNIFATYTPPDSTQKVWNLLSQGIVQADGSPGVNFALPLICPAR